MVHPVFIYINRMNRARWVMVVAEAIYVIICRGMGYAWKCADGNVTASISAGGSCGNCREKDVTFPSADMGARTRDIGEVFFLFVVGGGSGWAERKFFCFIFYLYFFFFIETDGGDLTLVAVRTD